MNALTVIKPAALPASYQAMTQAIAACERVDEAKHIADKAAALAVYYRQARNFEAERQVCAIRIRAERKVGELLKALERADHKRGNQYLPMSEEATQPSPFAAAIAANGISRQTASRFQALAEIPHETFEAALAAADKPTAHNLLALGKVEAVRDAPPPVSEDALWLWATMRDFEKRGYFDKDAAALIAEMNAPLGADMRRLCPRVVQLLSACELIGGPVRGTAGTGDDEWYTPAAYLDLARSVLGTIDLDPASHIEAQKKVGATRFYTKADDGLKFEWRGRVWLNPPYSRELVPAFMGKLIAEHQAGHVAEAIALTHNYTDTAWFQDSAAAAAAICFTRGRVRFEALDGRIAAPTQGQAFHYFGRDVPKFLRAFADVGTVMARAL